MKKMIQWSIGIVALIVLLPILPLLAWDIVRIVWSDVPWWAQLTVLLVAIFLMTSAIFKIIKKFRGEGGGRTEVHHYYHY